VADGLEAKFNYPMVPVFLSEDGDGFTKIASIRTTVVARFVQNLLKKTVNGSNAHIAELSIIDSKIIVPYVEHPRKSHRDL
jgi:hypothetical protein